MARRLAVAVVLLLVACDRSALPTSPAVPDAVPAAAPASAAGPVVAASAASVAAEPPASVFLAPLGAGVADPARFDAAAAPVIEICPWSGSACTASPVARFSTTHAGSTLPLTVDTAAGEYEASWDLMDPRFTTRQTYRIRALRGAAELEGVSVDVVRGRWALSRSDGTLAPLEAAATLPIRLGVTPLAMVGSLTNGATVTGHIQAAHQVDRWTFTATAGNHVVVSLGATGNSSGFVPWLRLQDASGAEVASNFGSSAAQVEFSAATTGTYTILVASADAGGVGTGDYRLTRIKAPGTLTLSAGDQGGPLTNGATHAGSIYTGDIDGWTFSANAGDRVIVSLGETSNSSGFSPWLRVISPSGTVVGSNFGFSAAQVEFSAPAAGSYTVVVGSAAGGFTGTGDYLLTLVRAPGTLTVSAGDQGGTLTNGGTRAASIYTGDVDGWTFSASAGDHVVVSLGATSNSSGFSPWLRVISPSGTVVGSNFGFSAAQVEFSAPAAGSYTVVVGSAAGGFTGTGDYLLTLVKAPGALTASVGDQGGTLPDGLTRAGSIYTGDVDGWTFSANAGDRVIVSLGETSNSSGFSPWLRVISPNGTVAGSNFGFSAAQLEFSAPLAGTYTVIVGSAGGGFTGTGDYLLTRISAPGTLDVSAGDQGGPLVNGATYKGSIYTGDVDGWTFGASAGDHVVVSLGATSNSSGFSPWLRVISPVGTVVGSNFGSSAAQVEFSAPAGGSYTVVVGSAASGFTGTGDYLLTRIKVPGALTVSAGDQGGKLTNGVARTGSIYTGDVDGWKFAANTGDPITVDLAETGVTSGFSPWLRVVSPSGVVVASNFGFTAAHVAFNAPATGSYTVIVGSAGGGFTGTGDYTLVLSGATATIATLEGVAADDVPAALAVVARRPGRIDPVR